MCVYLSLCVCVHAYRVAERFSPLRLCSLTVQLNETISSGTNYPSSLVSQSRGRTIKLKKREAQPTLRAELTVRYLEHQRGCGARSLTRPPLLKACSSRTPTTLLHTQYKTLPTRLSVFVCPGTSLQTKHTRIHKQTISSNTNNRSVSPNENPPTPFSGPRPLTTHHSNTNHSVSTLSERSTNMLGTDLTSAHGIATSGDLRTKKLVCVR